MSNIQRELLKLYANDISDEQLMEIRRLLGAYFANQATQLMHQWEKETGATADTYDAWTQERNPLSS